jgi:hypothetical protein
VCWKEWEINKTALKAFRGERYKHSCHNRARKKLDVVLVEGNIHVTWVLGDSMTHTCETGILYDFRICVLTKRLD